jgi:hypothetical protein
MAKKEQDVYELHQYIEDPEVIILILFYSDR